MSNKDKVKESDAQSVNPEDLDQKELQNFKLKVNRWCEIDNKIKQFEQVVKAHKKQKDELCGDILKFMEGYEISNIKTSFGKLEKIESETKLPITKTLISDKVNTYFSKIGLKNSKEQSEILIQDLYDNREKKKIVRLRRTAPKEPKDTSVSSKKSIVPESLKKI